MIVDEWVESVWTLINVRPKTLYDYKYLYRTHLQPVIGQMPVGEVISTELQKKLISLPPQTARHTLMVAKTIWREASLYNITKNNPTVGLRTAPIQQQSKKFLTWEEVESLDWGRYNNQIRFLATHGLRWSEAAALEESDIHENFVWINRSVYGPVKSKTSLRKVPYMGFFEKFPRSYKPIQKVANSHGVTVHSFRRTYAYLLKTQGIHVTTAQRLLGHSDPLMTLKVYTSVLDDEIDLAGIALLKKVGGYQD
jgi:integrase